MTIKRNSSIISLDIVIIALIFTTGTFTIKIAHSRFLLEPWLDEDSIIRVEAVPASGVNHDPTFDIEFVFAAILVHLPSNATVLFVVAASKRLKFGTSLQQALRHVVFLGMKIQRKYSQRTDFSCSCVHFDLGDGLVCSKSATIPIDAFCGQNKDWSAILIDAVLCVEQLQSDILSVLPRVDYCSRLEDGP